MNEEQFIQEIQATAEQMWADGFNEDEIQSWIDTQWSNWDEVHGPKEEEPLKIEGIDPETGETKTAVIFQEEEPKPLSKQEEELGRELKEITDLNIDGQRIIDDANSVVSEVDFANPDLDMENTFLNVSNQVMSNNSQIQEIIAEKNEELRPKYDSIRKDVLKEFGINANSSKEDVDKANNELQKRTSDLLWDSLSKDKKYNLLAENIITATSEALYEGDRKQKRSEYIPDWMEGSDVLEGAFTYYMEKKGQDRKGTVDATALKIKENEAEIARIEEGLSNGSLFGDTVILGSGLAVRKSENDQVEGETLGEKLIRLKEANIGLGAQLLETIDESKELDEIIAVLDKPEILDGTNIDEIQNLVGNQAPRTIEAIVTLGLGVTHEEYVNNVWDHANAFAKEKFDIAEGEQPTADQIAEVLLDPEFDRTWDLAGGVVSGQLERIGATQIFNIAKAGTKASRSLFRMGAKDIVKKGGDFAFELANSGTAEALTETFQTITTAGVQLLNTGETDITAREISEAAVQGGLIGAILPGGLRVTRRSLGEVKNGYEIIAAKQTEGARKEALVGILRNLETAVNDGQITEEEAVDTAQELSDTYIAAEKLPDNLADDKRADALKIIKKRDKIADKIKGKDPLLVQKEKEQIKALNNQLAELVGVEVGTDGIADDQKKETKAPKAKIQKEQKEKKPTPVKQEEVTPSEAVLDVLTGIEKEIKTGSSTININNYEDTVKQRLLDEVDKIGIEEFKKRIPEALYNNNNFLGGRLKQGSVTRDFLEGLSREQTNQLLRGIEFGPEAVESDIIDATDPTIQIARGVMKKTLPFIKTDLKIKGIGTNAKNRSAISIQNNVLSLVSKVGFKKETRKDAVGEEYGEIIARTALFSNVFGLEGNEALQEKVNALLPELKEHPMFKAMLKESTDGVYVSQTITLKKALQDIENFVNPEKPRKITNEEAVELNALMETYGKVSGQALRKFIESNYDLNKVNNKDRKLIKSIIDFFRTLFKTFGLSLPTDKGVLTALEGDLLKLLVDPGSYLNQNPNTAQTLNFEGSNIDIPHFTKKAEVEEYFKLGKREYETIRRAVLRRDYENKSPVGKEAKIELVNKIARDIALNQQDTTAEFDLENNTELGIVENMLDKILASAKYRKVRRFLKGDNKVNAAEVVVAVVNLDGKPGAALTQALATSLFPEIEAGLDEETAKSRANAYGSAAAAIANELMALGLIVPEKVYRKVKKKQEGQKNYQYHYSILNGKFFGDAYQEAISVLDKQKNRRLYTKPLWDKPADFDSLKHETGLDAITKGAQEPDTKNAEWLKVLNNNKNIKRNVNTKLLEFLRWGSFTKDDKGNIVSDQAALTYSDKTLSESKRALKSAPLLATIRIADEIGSRPYYMLGKFDFRGRLNQMMTNLNPQSNKLGKAFAYFNNKKAIGEHGWKRLLVQLADTEGEFEGQTIGERAAYAESKLDEWIEMLNNSKGKIDVFKNADEPFLFVATLLEVRDALKNEEAGKQSRFDYKSGLPIRIDATVSQGQQIAALMKSRKLGEMFNLLYKSTRRDFYTELGKAVFKKYKIPSTDQLKQMSGISLRIRNFSTRQININKQYVHNGDIMSKEEIIQSMKETYPNRADDFTEEKFDSFRDEAIEQLRLVENNGELLKSTEYITLKGIISLMKEKFPNRKSEFTYDNLSKFIDEAVKELGLIKNPDYLSQEEVDKLNEKAAKEAKEGEEVKKISAWRIVTDKLNAWRKENKDDIKKASAWFWASKWEKVRSIMKKPVMTFIYGAGDKTIKAKILTELSEEPDFAEVNETFVFYLGNDIMKAFKTEINDIIKYKKALQTLAKEHYKKWEKASKEEKESLEWLNFIGQYDKFPFSQRYLSPIPGRVEWEYTGEDPDILSILPKDGRIQMNYTVGSKDLNEEDASTAIAANFTHFQDAQVVHYAINENKFDVDTVHDDFATTPFDTDTLQSSLNEAMVNNYEDIDNKPVFQHLIEEAIGEEIAKTVLKEITFGDVKSKEYEKAVFAFGAGKAPGFTVDEIMQETEDIVTEIDQENKEEMVNDMEERQIPCKNN